jgi:DNA-binding transcriptional LysR family regulator
MLFDDPLCIASIEKFDLTELPKLPRIDFHTDYSFKIILDTWWRENFTDPPFISMEVDKMDACKEMVLHGLGYGILPYTLVKDNDNLYKINLTDKNGQTITRRAWMIYQKSNLEINIVKAFVDFVKGIDFTKPL